jgi:hypothetical protein
VPVPRRNLAARATDLIAAILAAWGSTAYGTTGPGTGTGPDSAVLPTSTRLAQIPRT